MTYTLFIYVLYHNIDNTNFYNTNNKNVKTIYKVDFIESNLYCDVVTRLNFTQIFIDYLFFRKIDNQSFIKKRR